MSEFLIKGTLFQIQDGEDWVSVQNLINLGHPARNVTKTAKSYIDSTATGFLLGIIDNGDFNFQVGYDPTKESHILLDDLAASPAKCAMRIVLPDADSTTFSWTGAITSFAIGAGAVNDQVVADGTVAIDGDVVKTSGA